MSISLGVLVLPMEERLVLRLQGETTAVNEKLLDNMYFGRELSLTVTETVHLQITKLLF